MEVPRFNARSAEEREKTVAVIRAVGVVFAESGNPVIRAPCVNGFGAYCRDPSEKVRRYAIAAMPKIGVGADDERKLLSVLRAATEQREKKFLTRTLGRIGGRATLEAGVTVDVEQKVKASMARRDAPSAIHVQGVAVDFKELRINLRGRAGLEQIVGEEVEERRRRKEGKFRVVEIGAGGVTIAPAAPFTLGDIYAMRCFGAAGFVLGHAGGDDEAESIEALAAVITSPLSRRLLQTFTTGAIRYRLNFAGKGHQRAAVARLAGQVYARYPEILNDARRVTWTVDIFQNSRGHLVELRPNMTPDPRFSYRQQDVPAASHPPLAACLARLAGRVGDEVIWDPFCGSGSELVESALLGGARRVIGTDRSAEAIRIAQANYARAKIESIPAKFICGDFRDVASSHNLRDETVSLIITNPPLGMRVPVADLRQLIADLFAAGVKVLKPGGRLVMVNPLLKAPFHPMLELVYQQKVDLGGFEGRMEKYLRKAPR